MWLNTRRFSKSTRKLGSFFPKGVELAKKAVEKAPLVVENADYKRLKNILLMHNPKLTNETLQEVIPFVIKRYGLDKTSIWDLDEEYLHDLVAGG